MRSALPRRYGNLAISWLTFFHWHGWHLNMRVLSQYSVVGSAATQSLIDSSLTAEMVQLPGGLPHWFGESRPSEARAAVRRHNGLITGPNQDC